MQEKKWHNKENLMEKIKKVFTSYACVTVAFWRRGMKK